MELTEKGRKLSAKNEGLLRKAFDSLRNVLAQLEDEQADDGDETETTEAGRPATLHEARNVGEWLEARLHLTFAEIADGMFGEGRLTREERIALSSAIGDALDAFRAGVEAGAVQLYARDLWQEPESAVEANEAAVDVPFVALVEQALRRDGTIPIKLIAPGWGSSGFYPAAVLERDGPAVFAAGTKMFWNHPTLHEEATRPEGDLNALAAELVSPAQWMANGPKGPGLYADAKVFGPFQEHVNELAQHIGVSIRASGRAAQGEADGRKGPIIQQIVAAKSVDFVTEPGAGGRIVEMFEAARGRRASTASTDNGTLSQQEDTVSQEQLTEAQRQIDELRAQNARMQEALLLRDAREFVGRELGGVTLPDVTKARLAQQLAGQAVIVEGQIDEAGYRTRIAEAVAAEQQYLAQAAGWGTGRIVGMGSSEAAGQQGGEDADKRLGEALGRMGLSEAGVKAATAQRR